QLPLQVLTPGRSADSVYSVMRLWSTTMLPAAPAFSVPTSGIAVGDGLGNGVGCGVAGAAVAGTEVAAAGAIAVAADVGAGPVGWAVLGGRLVATAAAVA